MGRSQKRSVAHASFRSATKQGRIPEQPEMPTGVTLQDGWLSQFGTDYFRNMPRFEQEFDVSVLLGRLTRTQITYSLFGRKPAAHHTHRYFDIAKLVVSKYRCLHTGSERNPQHASILAGCPDEDIEAHRSWWSDPRRTTLDRLAEQGAC